MGIIFSAFAWTYALAQIPGGMFLDRFGNKVTYALSIFFWSLFTLLQSFTLGLKSLLLLRLGTRRQRSALLSGQQPHRQHPGSLSMSARGQRQRIQLVNI